MAIKKAKPSASKGKSHDASKPSGHTKSRTKKSTEEESLELAASGIHDYEEGYQDSKSSGKGRNLTGFEESEGVKRKERPSSEVEILGSGNGKEKLRSQELGNSFEDDDIFEDLSVKRKDRGRHDRETEDFWS